VLASLLGSRTVEAESPLDPDRPLPHMLDFFSLRFRVG
jgi:hypothetical protein